MRSLHAGSSWAGPAPRTQSPWWRLAPTALAACLAAVFLAVEPHTVDYAAHVFRAELFEREGFALWNNHWYGGHHTPAYSVLFPPLAALLGPATVGALACVGAAAAFEALVHDHFGHAARWGALWFGAGAATMLFTGRLPFALGVALGLAALLALRREELGLAVVLAAASSLASPVAGAFLALAALAYALAGRRPAGLTLVVAALLPPLALAAAFPEGGSFPFGLTAFAPIPLLVAGGLLLLPLRERTLRIGLVLYGAAALAAFVLETPVGGNATRLGALFAGPVAACALLGRGAPRRPAALLAAVFAALAVWQWMPAIRDLRNAATDPGDTTSFYTPVLGFLERSREPPSRVEVVFTKSHWEAVEVGTRFPLARGWERQLDIDRNALFYEGRLSHRSYARWLADQGVRYVALPFAARDHSGEREARLVAADPPYLALRFRAPRWRVYEFLGWRPLVSPEGRADVRLLRIGEDHVELDVRKAGSAVVRVRFTPYWRLESGCVERAGEWTRVIARRPGPARLAISFSPARVFSRGRRCA